MLKGLNNPCLIYIHKDVEGLEKQAKDAKTYFKIKKKCDTCIYNKVMLVS